MKLLVLFLRELYRFRKDTLECGKLITIVRSKNFGGLFEIVPISLPSISPHINTYFATLLTYSSYQLTIYGHFSFDISYIIISLMLSFVLLLVSSKFDRKVSLMFLFKRLFFFIFVFPTKWNVYANNDIQLGLLIIKYFLHLSICQLFYFFFLYEILNMIDENY
jgi:hypothetical protein